MAIYTVLAPRTSDSDADPMAVVLVREGFAWAALLVPELWLIFRRMWWILAAYVAVALVFIFAGPKLGEVLPVAFLLLARLLFALEGNELRRWTLRRRGYGIVAVVEGRGLEEAEIRYFAAREEMGGDDAATISSPPAPPPASPPPPAKLGPITPSVEAGDVVGLFPAPQRGGGA